MCYKHIMYGNYNNNMAMIDKNGIKCFLISVLLLLGACGNMKNITNSPKASAEKELGSNGDTFTKIAFTQTDHWGEDKKLEEVIPAFYKSCEVYSKRALDSLVTENPRRTIIADWVEVCKPILNKKIDANNVKEYFENNFDIYLIKQKNTGFITGYYHIFLKGSRHKTDKYKYPIYGVPDDLVKINTGTFRISDASAARLVGRVVNNEVVPYYSAFEIEAEGALEGKAKIIAYVESRLERFLLHVQGSGTILLEDGSELKLDYAAQNGLPYKGLSKDLVEKNYIERGNVNLETMMAVYKEYPEEIAELMLENKSYIFLKESDTKDVIGGMGVGLTPKRSVAIDLNYISYGVPLWLEMKNYNNEDIDQMMVGQDRGGAIIGANRLDFYWGKGYEAGTLAGNTKNKASVYLLLPKKKEN